MVIQNIFISVGISFPGLQTKQKCSIGTSCTVKCEVTAGDRPDIDWLTKDGIINFYSGSKIGFSREISPVVVHRQLKSASLVSLIWSPQSECQF